jgi:hypothetical protein
MGWVDWFGLDRGPLQLPPQMRRGTVANNLKRPFSIVRLRFIQIQRV